MKALVRKDLLETFTAMRTIFLIMAVFAAAAALAEGCGFYIPYLVILPGVLGTTLINLDTREKWDIYALTLPVNRRTVITSRYVYTLIMLLDGTLLGTVCFLIRYARGFESGGVLSAMTLCFAGGLVTPAVGLPLAYKFGPDKGRYAMMFLLIGIMFAAMSVFHDGFAPSDALAAFPVWATLPAALALFAASWAVSAAIYEKKEIA